MSAERIVVAEIIRPQGNRGELLLRSQTDVPGRLESLKMANVLLVSGLDVPVEIEAARAHKTNWVVKLAGVNSIDEAEQFRGADLWVLPAERGELESGEYFRSDLTGCQVVDSVAGGIVGRVAGWQDFGMGPVLMEVEAEGREYLIPFVGSECEVDLERRTIRMKVPEGLLEL